MVERSWIVGLGKADMVLDISGHCAGEGEVFRNIAANQIVLHIDASVVLLQAKQCVGAIWICMYCGRKCSHS